MPAATDPELAPSTTLAILAGGEGSRMGIPKGLLIVDGQPILGYLLKNFAWPGPTLLVTAPGREHPPGHDQFFNEVTDPASEQAGPLCGILTALDSIKSPLLLVTTVDMPGIRPAHLHWLVESLQAHPQVLGLMTYRVQASTEQIEPFPAVFRAAAREVIAQRLATGRRSVHRLLDDPRFLVLPAPAGWDVDTWTNLNSPADLKRWKNEMQ